MQYVCEPQFYIQEKSKFFYLKNMDQILFKYNNWAK